MDSGPHTERRAELRHPYEHVGGKLLRPGQVKRGERDIDPVGRIAQPGEAVRVRPVREPHRIARAVTVHHGNECDAGGGSDQDADDPLFESIENAVEQVEHGPSAPRYSSPLPLVGRGRGWGSMIWALPRLNLPTPHPDPPPQGGREKKPHTRCNCLAPAGPPIILGMAQDCGATNPEAL